MYYYKCLMCLVCKLIKLKPHGGVVGPGGGTPVKE